MTTIPITIGGRTALIEKPEPDHCSAPWCKGEVVATCKFKLTDRSGNPSGRTCDKDICGKHTGKRGLCLAHERLTDQREGKVRMVP